MTPALLLAVTLRAAPARVEMCTRPSQTDCVLEITPAPPPPPPVAQSEKGKAAVARLRACMSGPPDDPTDTLRYEAERAVKDLSAEPGTAEWTRAARSVIAYAGRRVSQKACINDLDSASLNLSLSQADRLALTSETYVAAQQWTNSAETAASILLHLVGRREAILDDQSPPIISPLTIGARLDGLRRLSPR